MKPSKQELINIIYGLLIVGLIWRVSIATPIGAAPTVVNATPSPAPQVIIDDSPAKYIKEVFGVYADKAFLLLQGNGELNACAENRYLDPKAVNDNRSWGGVGRDRGIFQISDYYHPGVSDACAFDYRCNTDYAWRMFVNDGYSFRRWSCGRWYGI